MFLLSEELKCVEVQNERFREVVHTTQATVDSCQVAQCARPLQRVSLF